MEVVVFIPGIMGSELYHDTAGRIWPAPAAQIVLRYKYEAELSQPDLRVGDIIRRVGPIHQYDDLIEDLAALGFRDQRLVVFPYDWRKDIACSARLLGDRLARLVAEIGPTVQINLIGHSMGGLVARYFLEADLARDPDLDPTARAKVKRMITLGTPQRGAPLALSVALGKERRVFLSAAQVLRLASNPEFPAVYQLLPAPGEHFAWSAADDSREQPIDVYERSNADRLGLVTANLDAAVRFHAQLDPRRAPASVRYFAFYGTRHKTVSHVELHPEGGGYGVHPRSIADAGDGTVPVWSGLLPGIQGMPVGGEHQRLFRDDRLRASLGALLGMRHALRRAVPATQLSLAEGVVDVGRTKVEANLSPGRARTQLHGQLWWEQTDAAASERVYTVVPGSESELAYTGPEVSKLSFEVALPTTSGCYRLCYGRDGEAIAMDELIVQELT